jgi:hypothetical protein
MCALKLRPMRFVPWWNFATLGLLGLALALTVAAGRAIEAVIAGVLTIPSLFVVGLWLYERRRR